MNEELKIMRNHKEEPASLFVPYWADINTALSEALSNLEAGRKPKAYTHLHEAERLLENLRLDIRAMTIAE
jgi:hypothetical protein|nr:MAG TPA: hypothetical protein [Caudoviricetes sp.]